MGMPPAPQKEVEFLWSEPHDGTQAASKKKPMTDAFYHIQFLAPLAIIGVLLFFWGKGVAERSNRSGKTWFLLFQAFLFSYLGGPSAKTGEIWIMIPIIAILGFLFETIRPIREKIRYRLKERQARAAQSPNTPVIHSVLGFAGTVMTGVATYFLTHYLFDFGTTDATGAGFVTAAILGFAFKYT